jgi:hypothetical protein
MTGRRDRRGGVPKWLVWLLVVLIGLPVLFYLFEYVVPHLLPTNF